MRSWRNAVDPHTFAVAPDLGGATGYTGTSVHTARAERPGAVIVGALIVGLLAYTCVFTPPRPIAFGKHVTAMGPAGAPASPVLNKRNGKPVLFGLVEPVIAVWSLAPIAADSVLCPYSRDIRRPEFQRSPLGSRPPPIAI